MVQDILWTPSRLSKGSILSILSVLGFLNLSDVLQFWESAPRRCTLSGREEVIVLHVPLRGAAGGDRCSPPDPRVVRGGLLGMSEERTWELEGRIGPSSRGSLAALFNLSGAEVGSCRRESVGEERSLDVGDGSPCSWWNISCIQPGGGEGWAVLVTS